MVNYGNAKVYKIWSTAGDKIYIGSTTKRLLSQRMDTHRSGYTRWKNGKSGLVTSYLLFNDYGLENCLIELLEAKECNTKDELKQIEGKYIRSLLCVNKIIPDRTKKEHREEHKEKAKLYHEEYRENNQLKIKQLNQQYRENNKAKINESKNKKTKCGCGGSYVHSSEARHFRTIKHCQYIASLQ